MNNTIINNITQNIDFGKLFEQILDYPLIEVIGQDTQLKPSGINQWIGKSPFREEKHASFSVGQKNGNWFYFDHSTGEGGNIFTYLKEKYQLVKNILIADFLGIEIPYLNDAKRINNNQEKKKSSNFGITVDWEAEEEKRHWEIIKYHQNELKKRNIDLEPIDTKASLEGFAKKRIWEYPSTEVEVWGKKMSTKKHLKNKVTITPQKYRDDNNIKKWRYAIEKHYTGFSETSYIYTKEEVAKKYNLPDFAPEIYNQNNIINSSYLVLTEGESDCDAAIACGFNAGSMPSPNLENQVKLLKQLKNNKPEIEFIIIFADNDYTGIHKASQLLESCKQANFAAIAINLYTKKIILHGTPEIDLIKAVKENQKWINEKQGYDFRDFVNQYLVKETNEIFVEIKAIILSLVSEFKKENNLGKKPKKTFSELWENKYLKNNELDYQRISLFHEHNKELQSQIKKETSITFLINSKDIKINESFKTICCLNKYLEKKNKTIEFKFNNQDITYKNFCKIAVEMQRINEQYYYSSHILLNEMFLSGDILEKALKNLSLKGKLVAIRSGLGTNKTGSIGEFINNHSELKNRGTLQLSDINRLLTQTVERYNKLPKSFYHLHQDKAHELIGDEKSNIACCFQSLLNFKIEEVEEKVIIIDENMSVIFSLLDGGTFPNPVIQQLIKQRLEDILRSSYCVFILDGNLTNSNVELMGSLCSKEIIKIENKLPKPKNYQLKIVDNWDACIAQAIDDYISDKKVTICADSQSELRRIYHILLNKCGFDASTILIGDKNSTETECPNELLSNPSEYFVNHPEIKMFLYSPSMGRGFDIQGDIFDYQYSYFCGVLSIDQIDQMPFRIRSEKIERTLFIKNLLGDINGLNKYSQVNQNEHKKYINVQIAELGKTIIEAVNLLNLNNLKPDFETIVTNFTNDPLFKYGDNLDKFNKQCSEDLAFSFYCFGLLKDYNIFFDNFSHSGSETITETKEIIKKEIKEERVKLFEQNVTNIINVDDIKNEIDITKQKLNDVETKLSNTALYTEKQKEELGEEKTYLKEYLEQINSQLIKTKKQIDKIDRKFPQIIKSQYFKNKEVIATLLEEKQSKQLNSQLTRYYYLGQDCLPSKVMEQQLYLFIKSERATGSVWINDFNTEALLINTLKEMKLYDLIQNFSFGKGVFNKDSQDILSISANWDSLILGDRPEKTLFQVKAVLKLVGFDIFEVSRDRDGLRNYSILPSLIDFKDKENIESNYTLFSGFYSNLVTSIGIRISQQKKYPIDWSNLPVVDETLNPHFSSYIYNKESVGLINSQPSNLEGIIKAYKENIDEYERCEDTTINSTLHERSYFKNGLVIELSFEALELFWQELNKSD